ncbi:MAG TPA: RNA polymerase factor sigma-54, partial [Planctomycetota bacterium]|nr:RNA polymerase factor sigma-54 [Planctomycetota bacterium]
AAPDRPPPPVDPDEVRHVLDELRRATHPALGARDVRESLLLQLEALDHGESLAARIVAGHLDEVIKNQLPRIAKETGSTLEEVVAALEFLKHLDPTPGRDYGGTTASVIHPDVIVEEQDGEYEVRLAHGQAPRLQLTPSYRQLLADADRAAAEEDPVERERTRVWLRRKLDGARWFLDAVEQRQGTVLRIAKAIFAHQREFLAKGPKSLKPLRMQEVADETGVHISTVSRAVAGKYAQTPRGIHPLKFFFTSGTTDEAGEATSQVSIQQRLKEIVDGEDPEQPLSDDQLGAELHKRHGVRIARRTVTKYRKALGIPPSIQRRRF